MATRTTLTSQVQHSTSGLLPPGSIGVGLAAELCLVMGLAHLQCGPGLSAVPWTALGGMFELLHAEAWCSQCQRCHPLAAQCLRRGAPGRFAGPRFGICTSSGHPKTGLVA